MVGLLWAQCQGSRKPPTLAKIACICRRNKQSPIMTLDRQALYAISRRSPLNMKCLFSKMSPEGESRMATKEVIKVLSDYYSLANDSTLPMASSMSGRLPLHSLPSGIRVKNVRCPGGAEFLIVIPNPSFLNVSKLSMTTISFELLSRRFRGHTKF